MQTYQAEPMAPKTCEMCGHSLDCDPLDVDQEKLRRVVYGILRVCGDEPLTAVLMMLRMRDPEMTVRHMEVYLRGQTVRWGKTMISRKLKEISSRVPELARIWGMNTKRAAAQQMRRKQECQHADT